MYKDRQNYANYYGIKNIVTAKAIEPVEEIDRGHERPVAPLTEMMTC